MCKKQGGTLPYALLILLQSVLYGFGNPLSKIGFESITVLWCLGIRFSGAAALMLLLQRILAVLSRGLTQYGRISVRQNRVCLCQSMVSPADHPHSAGGDRGVVSAVLRRRERRLSWPAWCWKTGRAAENKPHKDKRTFLFERPLIFL